MYLYCRCKYGFQIVTSLKKENLETSVTKMSKTTLKVQSRSDNSEESDTDTELSIKRHRQFHTCADFINKISKLFTSTFAVFLILGGVHCKFF